MDRLSFGEVLKRHRRARRLRQQDVATRAGTSKGYLSDMENNPEIIPGHDLALRLVQAVDAKDATPFLRAMGYPLGTDALTLDDFLNIVEEQVASDEKSPLYMRELALSSLRAFRASRTEGHEPLVALAPPPVLPKDRAGRKRGVAS